MMDVEGTYWRTLYDQGKPMVETPFIKDVEVAVKLANAKYEQFKLTPTFRNWENTPDGAKFLWSLYDSYPAPDRTPASYCKYYLSHPDLLRMAQE